MSSLDLIFIFFYLKLYLAKHARKQGIEIDVKINFKKNHISGEHQQRGLVAVC